ncbi:DUF4173 domain-containing protein [Rhodobacteraceae bacterium D3-12]|nr:DUF4173 domain-containing protein [Rhodobacteraceae bacterium D3-12]
MFLLRGVPQSVQTDGWWLSSAPPSPPRPPIGAKDGPKSTDSWALRAGALVGLLALADGLIWQVVPGVSLAVFGLAVLGIGWICAGFRGGKGVILAALLFLPVLERAQALSLGFWVLGLVLGAGWIALARFPGLSGALRFLLHAPETVSEGLSAMYRRGAGSWRGGLHAGVLGWLLPLGLGALFLVLLSNANPLLYRWLSGALWVDGPGIAPDRVMFWALMALLLWPFVSLGRMRQRLDLGFAPPRARRVPRVFNEGSVRRSLVMFNVVFAVQSLTDLAILSGGATLPAGMSYAEYAHRGAYPLLVTALLAGAFALVARPFTTQSRVLRLALLGWLGQTFFLVISSLFRLESYVFAYGLTHLRLAALVWMGLVAVGVLLVMWQVLRHHGALWMLKRCGLLGIGTLYLCSFLSFADVIARFNLSHDVPVDARYLCQLDRAAVPAIRDFELRSGRTLCGGGPLEWSADWREWGFRDWRTARSLAALETAGAVRAWPTF